MDILQRTPIIYPECGGCLQKLTDREFLTCKICNITYDLLCGNVSEALFRKVMTRESKNKWECQWCINKRVRGDNTNTPVGRHNIDNNVTKRKPRLLRQLSLENITISDGTIDWSSLNVTPETSHNESFEIEHLKIELAEMTNQLIKAKQEINTLQKENSNLKLSLENLNDVKNNNPAPKNKTANEAIQNVPEICVIHALDNVTTPHLDNDCVAEEIIRMRDPKILIIGDQTCKNLGTQLINQRHKYKNVKEYTILNCCYPNAPADHILKNCNLNEQELRDHDWVVLSVGSNDTNPTKLCIELTAILKTLSKPNVLLMEIVNNPYLNEDKLNHDFKKIANNFPNCKFLSVSTQSNNNYSKRPTTNVKRLVTIINNVINNQDYNKCFIGSNITKTTKTKDGTRDTTFVTKESKYKHGTIPYFFEKMNASKRTTLVTCKLDEKPQSDHLSKNVAKPGTIPFYFQTLTKKPDCLPVSEIPNICNVDSPNLFRN